MGSMADEYDYGSDLVKEDKTTVALAKSFAEIIDIVGEDKEREGLKKTPERCAKALQFFTKGYNETLKGLRKDLSSSFFFFLFFFDIFFFFCFFSNFSFLDVVNGAVFTMDPGHDDMIVVKDIEIYSLCEHHMVPFFGKVHMAYIPKDKVFLDLFFF